MSIRIGIIGTGGMARFHAENFRRIRAVQLSACLDVVPGRAEAFARRHGVAHVARNLDELFERVDAVSVVTPDRFHAGPSLAALRAGKHLLCEKPLTVTLEEARRVAAVAKAAGRRGVRHLVNFSYRRSAAFQQARTLLAAGALGKLRHVHSFYLQSWLSADMWGHWTQEALLWRLDRAAGSAGVLGDIGCHILDLTTGVAGEVRRIRCDLRTFPKISPRGRPVTAWQGRRLDANDTAVIEIEFANGALGLVQTTRWATGHVNHLRFEAHGTDGALRFDLDRSYEQLELCRGADQDRARWRTRNLRPAPTIWDRFIRSIRTGRPDQPDVLRGAQIQAYLDACARSAKSGRWESIRAWV